MRDFDPEKARAHRLREAEAGFPLLRGCPNTAAIAKLTFLDGLSDAERIAFSAQLSDFSDAQSADPAKSPAMSPAKSPTVSNEALTRAAPLVEAFLAARRAPAQGVAFLPVKLYAGVCKDTGVGGFAGWAKMVSMPVDAQAPAAAHAASLDELVPVAPKRLRKLIDDAMTARFGASAERVSSDHTRYKAPLPDGEFILDCLFARGMGAAHQFEHHFNTKMANGRSVWMKSYEGVWRTMSRWDYVTETNAERSIAHFVRVVEACIELI